MGFKIQELTHTHAKGLLDGVPFDLEVRGKNYIVQIHDEAIWRQEKDVTGIVASARPARSDVRHMAYHAIAQYRNESRILPCGV